MNEYDNRLKLDIFKFPTTYQNDYQKFALKKNPTFRKNEYFEEREKKAKEYVLQDNETFAKWRPNIHIPFNLLWRSKEIINTNPYKSFNIPNLPQSRHKEEAIKVRPRIYMSPAVSMDDIEDPATRALICNHMYTSEWTKAIQESAVQAAKRYIPNTTVEPSGDPVRLKIDLLPPLPDAFRNNGKDWETSELRMTVDPSTTFWKHKDPPVQCGACFDRIKGLVPEETKQQIRELISQDKLRLVHDAPIPGYAGYKPRFSGRVSLAKLDLPVMHPFMSVTQAITKRYTVDKPT